MGAWGASIHISSLGRRFHQQNYATLPSHATPCPPGVPQSAPPPHPTAPPIGCLRCQSNEMWVGLRARKRDRHQPAGRFRTPLHQATVEGVSAYTRQIGPEPTDHRPDSTWGSPYRPLTPYRGDSAGDNIHWIGRTLSADKITVSGSWYGTNSPPVRGLHGRC